ncbi:MAG TPA: thioredoxin [Spirochaetota bacterium]|nr:thioredoxin [Spirochaetota bacterium]
MNHLSKQEFMEKIFDYTSSEKWSFKGNRPAIVDFYAEWCGPCKMISPVLEDLAKQYDGKIDIYKVNTDEASDLASDFGITSVPTLLFIPKDGEPRFAQGALPRAAFQEIIRDVLKVEA